MSTGNGHDDEESGPHAPRTVRNRDLWTVLMNLEIKVNTRLVQIRDKVSRAPEPLSEELRRDVGDGLADVGEHFAHAAIAVKRP